MVFPARALVVIVIPWVENPTGDRHRRHLQARRVRRVRARILAQHMRPQQVGLDRAQPPCLRNPWCVLRSHRSTQEKKPWPMFDFSYRNSVPEIVSQQARLSFPSHDNPFLNAGLKRCSFSCLLLLHRIRRLPRRVLGMQRSIPQAR